ncbi:hypothetical protein MPSEU_000350200 [Mayamaea pseudoterrestris]|nr:hypothetical protein MPSEU_000350200 [Mayamaea pseudoterrestris]
MPDGQLLVHKPAAVFNNDSDDDDNTSEDKDGDSTNNWDDSSGHISDSTINWDECSENDNSVNDDGLPGKETAKRLKYINQWRAWRNVNGLNGPAPAPNATGAMDRTAHCSGQTFQVARPAARSGNQHGAHKLSAPGMQQAQPHPQGEQEQNLMLIELESPVVKDKNDCERTCRKCKISSKTWQFIPCQPHNSTTTFAFVRNLQVPKCIKQNWPIAARGDKDLCAKCYTLPARNDDDWTIIGCCKPHRNQLISAQP